MGCLMPVLNTSHADDIKVPDGTGRLFCAIPSGRQVWQDLHAGLISKSYAWSREGARAILQVYVPAD